MIQDYVTTRVAHQSFFRNSLPVISVSMLITAITHNLSVVISVSEKSTEDSVETFLVIRGNVILQLKGDTSCNQWYGAVMGETLISTTTL